LPDEARLDSFIRMKFLAALVLGILMMGIIAAGLALTVAGKGWGAVLFIASLLAFTIAVGKIGCATH